MGVRAILERIEQRAAAVEEGWGSLFHKVAGAAGAPFSALERGAKWLAKKRQEGTRKKVAKAREAAKAAKQGEKKAPKQAKPGGARRRLVRKRPVVQAKAGPLARVSAVGLKKLAANPKANPARRRAAMQELARRKVAQRQRAQKRS